MSGSAQISVAPAPLYAPTGHGFALTLATFLLGRRKRDCYSRGPPEFWPVGLPNEFFRLHNGASQVSEASEAHYYCGFLGCQPAGRLGWRRCTKSWRPKTRRLDMTACSN